MDINYTNTRIYTYTTISLKINSFIYSLRVFRSGAFLVSSGREFQVEIAKEMRQNWLFTLPPNPSAIILTNTNLKQRS